MMTHSARSPVRLDALDSATRQLTRLAAVVTAGNEERVRNAIVASADHVSPVWVEELLLQTYLFAGFPRALNAMREWRRVCPITTVEEKQTPRYARDDETKALGEATCATVYGDMYDRLRENIRGLHPL